MGARLRVFLTAEQERTLFELRTATTVPQRVKDRAEVLRLSSQGWYALENCQPFEVECGYRLSRRFIGGTSKD